MNTWLIFICLTQGFLLIVQDMSPEYFGNRAKLLGKLFCGENNETASCVMKFDERVKFVQLLVNETYQSLKNVPTFVEKFIADVRQKAGKREEDDDLYRPPKPVKGHVAETMWNAIKESQEKVERSVPKDYKNAVTKKLQSIAFDDYRTDGLCSVDLGIDPSIVKRQIADIASLTKMPEKLHDIFQSVLYVDGAGTKQDESTAVAANGSLHYILVSVIRKGKKCVAKEIGIHVQEEIIEIVGSFLADNIF